MRELENVRMCEFGFFNSHIPSFSHSHIFLCRNNFPDTKDKYTT